MDKTEYSEEFLNTVLKSACDPVEFQQRGSPHSHMLVLIENAPLLENNSEEQIVQFVNKYLTCSVDNEETASFVNLQTHKHSNTCRKKGKPICRFGFPLSPLSRIMLLYPLEKEVEKYKKKCLELQKAMNEYKDNENMPFDECLEKVAKMNVEEYIKCIRSSLKVPEVFLKRKLK